MVKKGEINEREEESSVPDIECGILIVP